LRVLFPPYCSTVKVWQRANLRLRSAAGSPALPAENSRILQKNQNPTQMCHNDQVTITKP